MRGYQIQEFTRDGYLVSTDKHKLDLKAIHSFLNERSYWAKGIPMETLEKAVAGSLCFGVYNDLEQVGLARVITDGATYAYLCDVYIEESHRGKGLSKWLMECILQHPNLQGLRRFCLITADAHSLYGQFGFKPLAKPEGYMEIWNQHVYKNPRF